MALLDSYTEQLKATIGLQKETIDGLNRVIALQQRQLDTLLYKVHRHLGLDEPEAKSSTRKKTGR